MGVKQGNEVAFHTKVVIGSAGLFKTVCVWICYRCINGCVLF